MEVDDFFAELEIQSFSNPFLVKMSWIDNFK